MTVDIEKVDWLRDEATREYIRENAERLKDRSAMTPKELAEAVTYCETVDNPYAYELLDRAGSFEKFKRAESYEAACEVLRKAARGLGIILV